MLTRILTTVVVLGTLAGLYPSAVRAEEPSWLRSKNSDVERGNEKLAAGDAEGALAAYDEAARALPSEGGVHLNRGLALLKQGKLDAAREALRLSTDSAGSPEVRSDAYYNMGIGFYRQAEAQAAEQKDEEAQKSFREASDAFRKALRQRPGNGNAAYNYEVTQRRLVELEKKQQEQEQNDQEKKDQEKEDGEEQQDQEQGGDSQDQEGDPNEDQQAQQDGEKKDQEKKDGEKKEQDQAKKPDPKKPDPKQEQPQQAQPQEQKPGEPKPVPADVAQALDALQHGEKNLEQQRAMQRAGGHRRPPEKDW